MVRDIDAPAITDTGAIANLANMIDLDIAATVGTLDTMKGRITEAPIVALVTRRNLSTVRALTSIHIAKNVLTIGAPDMKETQVTMRIAEKCHRHTDHQTDTSVANHPINQSPCAMVVV